MEADILDEHLMQARLHALIDNLHDAVLVENEARRIVFVNNNFCQIFGGGMSPEHMIGLDCSNAAEQSKAMFKNSDDFVARVEVLLEEKKKVIGDQVELANGRYFERDYIPVYIDNTYCGHMWKYRDVTDQKNIERNMIDTIFTSHEDDRKIFAEDLHEGLAQTLSGLTFQLDAIREKVKQLGDKELEESIKSIHGYIHHSVDHTRKLATDLMPSSIEHLGLLHSIKSYIASLTKEQAQRINYQSTESDFAADKKIEITVYRAFVELIGYAFKDDQVSQIDVNIKCSPSLKVEICIHRSTLGHNIESATVFEVETTYEMFQKRIEAQGGLFKIDKSDANGTISIVLDFQLQPNS